MSTFRIEHIDKGLLDEWILRKNDDGEQIGDDVIAEDVNQLSDGIKATQDVLLRTSILSPSVILKSNSGIAERLTMLENVAGKAGLQDIYENGNIISIKPSKPLTLGGNEEFVLDDIGNLSLKLSNFKVRGSQAEYLSIAKDKIHTYLSDLILGATSNGYNLNLLSGKNITFKDSYLTNAITVSELGQTLLETQSQSLVGAINELKNTSFNTTAQSVYNQSESGRIVTDGERGAIRIENGSGNPMLAALQVIGNMTVSGGTLESEKIKVGNLTIDPVNGLNTSLKIKTTGTVEASTIKNPVGGLTFADNKISVSLSDGLMSKLTTNSQTLVGAINELKMAADELGISSAAFAQQHDINGMHEVIITQAALGQDALKRFIVRNSAGNETVTINGSGDLIAKTATINGTSFAKILTDLSSHLANDGTSHAAVASHLISKNPHNTIESINSLRGDLTIQEGEGIAVLQNGKTLTINNTRKETIQETYNQAPTGDLVLDAVKNLSFRDSLNALIFTITGTALSLYRNLAFKGVGDYKIASDDRLEISSVNDLGLTTSNGNLNISATQAGKTVSIQGISFDSAGEKIIYDRLPQTVVGAINSLARDSRLTVYNHMKPIAAGTPICLTRNANNETRISFPVLDYHPCNDQSTLTDSQLASYADSIYITEEDIGEAAQGRVRKIGPISFGSSLIAAGTNFEFDWYQGAALYLARFGTAEISIKDIAQLSSGDTFVLDNQGDSKSYMASSVLFDYSNGVFKIDSNSNLNLRKDATLKSIMDALNTESYTLKQGATFNERAYWDGFTAKGKLILNSNLAVGDTITITPTQGISGSPVVLTATSTPSELVANKFLIGHTDEETAFNIATAINLTTKSVNTEKIISIVFTDPSVTELQQLNGIPTTPEGHYCYARAIGRSVMVEWFRPGYSGNLISLSSSSPNVQIVPMSGGEGKIKIFLLDRTRDRPTNISSRSDALSITNFTAHENGLSPFVTYKSIKRDLSKDDTRRIKIGEIVNAAAGGATIFANIGAR